MTSLPASGSPPLVGRERHSPALKSPSLIWSSQHSLGTILIPGLGWARSPGWEEGWQLAIWGRVSQQDGAGGTGACGEPACSRQGSSPTPHCTPPTPLPSHCPLPAKHELGIRRLGAQAGAGISYRSYGPRGACRLPAVRLSAHCFLELPFPSLQNGDTTIYYMNYENNTS